ncbi:MAG: hypothetical protein IH840_07400, partial [Candidatus Heimdallarchaeota archaeon]|nr:hypothetical protein [Candidatus Heimdallarchaeota archaeon]
MSKKGEEKKDKEDKKSKKKDKKEKREIEFNLKDGVSWHDFVALIFIFFGFLWRSVRLVLAPIFWVYGENVRMIRFMRASGKDRTMTEDELLFVESMPFVITSTGLIGGILIGIFAAFSFSELIDDFIESINLNFIEGFFGIFATILGWIWAVFKFIIFGIGDIFGFVFNFFKDLFGGEPIFAFAVLVGIGIIGMIVWSVLAETGALERAYKVLKTVVVWVIGSPDRFRFRVDNYYRRFNHALTARLVGHGALMTRTHIFFKKVTVRTVFFSIYSFGAGIFIGITRSSVTTIEEQWRLVGLMSFVLFVAGIVAGTIFFGFMAR